MHHRLRIDLRGVADETEQQLGFGHHLAVNTGFGLVIAIPSMIFWRHFRATVDSLVIEMEQQAIRLVEVVHGERR